ncbi:CRISPR-associated endoribonuclease Cas6 [Alkalibaculum sp. M08DMB]|uniref:CRISPR-associated endoribonuclease Cas6 n=1 Tax=Alkalibaculum sporogenes TaxID=2655001 RepID=A0A6A7K550_9FIRM|nr:CRISPR-associated endoribonuclease Cas6 [Alkalibaculum sporogenes]MPW24505.1 CRISPR-associated endoribonuclease Cas6 [Alkalibaculum sporogenes]
MRFSTELLLDNELLPKDKNRIIISVLKTCFSSYNKDYFENLYEINPNLTKDFTFSLYLGQCKFLREDILIPEKKIILNFSAFNIEDGIMFYNSFLSNKSKQIHIKNNVLTINKINLIKEKLIYNDTVILKTLSPIVVREHCGDNQKTWYHSLRSEEGQVIFRQNLEYQLKDAFGERVQYDCEGLKVEFSDSLKEVKVKNYGIEVLSNIGKVKVTGQTYILDYLYKAGIGSKRGSGFGMVDIV